MDCRELTGLISKIKDQKSIFDSFFKIRETNTLKKFRNEIHSSLNEYCPFFSFECIKTIDNVEASSMVATPDGKCIFIYKCPQIQKINLETSQVESSINMVEDGINRSVNAMDISMDGKSLLICLNSADRKNIQIRSVDNLNLLKQRPTLKIPTRIIASVDGSNIIAGASKEISIFDNEVMGGRVINYKRDEVETLVETLSQSSDGKLLAVALGSRAIKIINLSDNSADQMELFTDEDIHKRITIYPAIITRDGKHVISNYLVPNEHESAHFEPPEPGHVKLALWDIESKRIISFFEGHKDNITSIKESHDGRFIISSSFDGSVKIWNKQSGRCLRTLSGHEHFLNCISLSQDGKRLITSAEDGSIKVWGVPE